MPFEKRFEPLLSRLAFLIRLGKSFAVTLAVVCFSLGMGSWGYHYFGEMPWVDALLNAAMILTGMGPVNPMTTVSGKLFSTFYALYSGIAFLTMVAILISPILHRFMHKFHLEEDEEANDR